MEPDWDVLQSITTTISLFPAAPLFRHVKAHQDHMADFSHLSLPAQLNIEADHLAGRYHYPPETSTSVAPLIDGTTASLHGPAGTISSNYCATLRRLSINTSLREYICAQNRWSSSIVDLIPWDAHGIAIRANFPCRHFVTKFIHNWLPLGHLTSKYAPHYSSHCPSCSTPTHEDRVHFLRCPSRCSWRGPLFDELHLFWMEQTVDPTLQFILSEALHCWLAEVPIATPSVGTAYSALFSHQSLIGCDQLWYGRFCLDWITLQDDYLRNSRSAPPHTSGRYFVTGTIKIIWDHTFTLWIRRNHDLHGHDAPSREAAAILQAQLEIQYLYSLRPYVRDADQILFYDTLEDHFTAETSAGSPILDLNVAPSDFGFLPPRIVGVILF